MSSDDSQKKILEHFSRPVQHWSVEFSRWLCRLTLFALRIKVTFQINEMRNGHLICCNHVSWLDILILHAITGCGFVAKTGIETWPVVGLLARYNGTIFVDRTTLSGRVQCLQKLRKRPKFSRVCVFPEGTTRRGLTPLQADWKQGWIWSARGHSVALVTLAYSQHGRMGWDDGESLFQNLLRVLRTNKKLCIVKTQLLEIPESATTSELRNLAQQSLKKICHMLLDSHGELKNAQN